LIIRRKILVGTKRDLAEIALTASLGTIFSATVATQPQLPRRPAPKHRHSFLDLKEFFILPRIFSDMLWPARNIFGARISQTMTNRLGNEPDGQRYC
jgi:hypothetical protein